MDADPGNECVQAHQHPFGLNAATHRAGSQPAVAHAHQTDDVGVFVNADISRQRIEQALHVFGRLQQRIAVAAPDPRRVMPGAEFLRQRIALEKFCAGTEGAQGRQFGVDMAEFGGVADGEEITVVAKVAVDGMLRDGLAHRVAGGTGNRRVDFEPGKAWRADQFTVGRMLVGHDKPRVACRSTLRRTLAVNHHDARLWVHLCQVVRGAEAGNAPADHQPIGLLRTAQATALRRAAGLGDPATYVFHC